MDLKEALLKEHSKNQTKVIAEYIGNKQSLFDKLIFLFLNSEYRVVQRAAWVVSYCGERHPDLLKKHIPILIKNLAAPDLHDAVKRNTLKVMQFIAVPDDSLGNLVDHCFRFAFSASEPIAVKVHSLNILFAACKKHPDLKFELLPLLKELSNDESPAIKSCVKHGTKIINSLNKK